jgi:PAS domain S-box-containing protein
MIMGGAPSERPPGAFQELVGARRAEIEREWEQAARPLAAAKGLDQLALVDMMPALLECIARLADEFAQGYTPGRREAIEIAAPYVNERVGQGFDIGQVVDEFAALRQSLLRVCLREVPLGRAELLALDMAVDRVVASSVELGSQARLRLLRTLDRVCAAALGTHDLHQLLEHLLRAMIEASPAVDTAAIFLREDDALVLAVSAGLGEGGRSGRRLQIGEGFAGRVALERRPLALRSAATDPLVVDKAFRRLGVRALYGTPLLSDGELIGVAHIGSLRAHSFAQEERWLFEALAGRAASAVLQQVLRDGAARAAQQARRAAELLEFGEAFLEVDRDYRVARVNRNQERLWRKPRAETIDRVLWEVWPEIAEPDGTCWRELHQAMEGRRPRQFDAYHAPLDMWTAISAHPVSGGGLALFLRDVTCRKRGEQERAEALALLEGVLASAPVGLAFVDRELRFVRINEALARMVGVPAGEALGRSAPEVLPRLAPAIEPLLRGIFETGEPILERELTGFRGAEERSWLASYYPVLDLGGRVFMAGAVLVDITERKRTEVHLRKMQEFEQQLLAITSHDLRNPLNAVLLGAQALIAHGTQPRTEVALASRIERAAARASRMVHDLLDLTRARLGRRIPIQIGDADLAVIAEQMAEELRPSSPQRTIRVETRGWTSGRWDRDRLAQLLGNLISNALKYGSQGTEVSISTFGEGDRMRLCVHNMGTPIPEEAIPTLFHPWKRAKPADALDRSIGLGLYIVECIAAAHGGSVEVQSSASGTTFTVTLPRETRPLADEDSSSPA